MQSALIRFLAVFSAIVTLYGAGYYHGGSSAEATFNKAKEVQANANAKTLTEIAAHDDKIITKYVTQVRTITKEVKVYVPSATNTCTELDGAFRLFYNEHATGITLPTPSSPIDAAPVPIETFTATDRENLIGCRQNIALIESWQEWASRK